MASYNISQISSTRTWQLIDPLIAYVFSEHDTHDVCEEAPIFADEVPAKTLE